MDGEDDIVEDRNTRTSSLWHYFEVLSEKERTAECKQCREPFSFRTSITNLRRHLERKHCNEMITKQSDDDEKDQMIMEEVYLEDEGLAEVSTDKRKILRNGAWEYFEVIDEEQRSARCRLCNEDFSYRTTSTNLNKHLMRKHCITLKVSDDENGQDDDKNTSERWRSNRNSISWEYFTVTDPVKRIATCKLCSIECSYWTSVSNLMKHVRRKHGGEPHPGDEYDSNEKADVSPPKRRKSNHNSISWEYFTIKDPEKRVAACKLCDIECSYWSSVSNLMKHVRRKHAGETYPEPGDDYKSDEKPDGALSSQRRSNQNSISWEYFNIKDPERRIATCKLCDCERSYAGSVSNLMKHVRRSHGVGTDRKYDSDEKMEETSNPKVRSSIWLYFKCINKKSGKSMCLICKKKLSHRSSITNLKRHLHRKHPQIELGDISADSKKMLISTDGQLYEIDENTNDAAEIEDDTDQNAEPMEIYLDEVEGNVIEKSHESKAKTSKRSSTNTKRIVIDDSNDDCSSNDEITLKKQYVRSKSDSLDRFGKYIVSLLRLLPNSVSNQLQADFVKQIMSCQRYEQEGVVNDASGFAITITETQPVATVEHNDSVFVQTALEEKTDEETSRSPVWIYFERHENKQGRARCAVCCATVSNAVKDLREHLKQKHPKLLAELALDSEQEDNDTDEMFTEIVYLEEPVKEVNHTNDRRATFSSRNKRAYANKPASKVTSKRRSTYNTDVVSPEKRNQYSENVRRNMDVDELDSFGNYVTCLLKKLPRDVSMNLQRDIINLIMNVKLNKVENEKKIVLDGNIIRTSEGSNYYLISNKKENGESDRQDCVAVTALENHSYSIVSAEDKEKQVKSSDSDPNESS